MSISYGSTDRDTYTCHWMANHGRKDMEKKKMKHSPYHWGALVAKS